MVSKRTPRRALPANPLDFGGMNMSPMLATASAVISLALVAYTIGVFSERRSGELKRSHLVFFWLGLICDSTGTGLMSIMAQNSGGAMSPLHPVTGFLAIALMLFHAVWGNLRRLPRQREDPPRLPYAQHRRVAGVAGPVLRRHAHRHPRVPCFRPRRPCRCCRRGSRPGPGAAALFEVFPRVGVGFAPSPQAWARC